MNQTLDPVFAAALRRDLVTLPAAKPRRNRRRNVVITTGVLSALTLTGVSAVAGLRPASEVISPALAPPIVLNGVGAAHVVLPKAPNDATYLRVELACYDGTRCFTPGGGSAGPDDGTAKVQRDAIPVTNQFDPDNAQVLAPLDPAAGLPIDVEPGTHWRLYVVYADRLNSTPAPVGDGRTVGIPGNQDPPDLVPLVASNGRSGYVDYHQLTDQARPKLTDDGTSQRPIPVYDIDGTTVIGYADVSQPYR
jgi:hypothetical protein